MEPGGFVCDEPVIGRPHPVMTAPVPTVSTSTARPQLRPDTSGPLVETLYTHSSVRIVSFTSNQRGLATPNQPIPPGSLPASSQLERTIAVGAFRIYRAPGSVAFLSCGSALQPIFPKSQCWRVNEDNSRFVLQIRRPQYWRIEVPIAHPDDARRAILLRRVLEEILLFEKTECPFQRSFTVRLPDPPITPIKKRAWTAEGKHLISSPFESGLSPVHDPALLSRAERTGSIPHIASPSNAGSSLGSEQGPNSGCVVDDRSLSHATSEFQHNSRDEAVLATDGEVSYRRASWSTGHHSPIEGTSRPETNIMIPISSIRAIGPASISSRDVTSTETQSTLADPLAYRAAGVTSHHEADQRTDTAHAFGFPLPRRAPAMETEGTLYDLDHVRGDIDDWSTCQVRPDLAPQIYPSRKCQLSMPMAVDRTTTQTSDTVGSDALLEKALPSQDGDVPDPVSLSCEDHLELFEGSGRVAPVNLARKRVVRMLGGRSSTAPSQLALMATLPPKSDEPGALSQCQSSAASTDSFHSVESWLPSPPASRPESPALNASVGAMGNNDRAKPMTSPIATEHATQTKAVIPGSFVVSDDSDDDVEPTPRRPRATAGKGAASAAEEVEGPRMPPSPSPSWAARRPIRRHSNASNLLISQRAPAPLPPTANIFAPPLRRTPQSRLTVMRRLPAAIIHKTMEILLSPPSHLVNLMLKVAAKIAAGEWRGLVFGLGEAGEQIPVQWDYYSDGEFSGLSDDDDDNDDCIFAGYVSSGRGSFTPTDVHRRSEWKSYDGDRSGVD
ncbi:inheritance of peroxisomes protein 1-domain-containing protein [Poronia punctata]|nr:inheritance of peroxisomes protein 1-domain-containing protein [Poronia punctata]